MTQLAGHKALVIGVETSAGGAIALALGRAGADLGLATMRADEGVLAARRIQRVLREGGGQATTYAFDVTLGQNVKVSTRQVAKELGGLDALVSASDLPFTGPLARLTDSDLAHVMTVNFYSHVFAVRAALDEFRRAGRGRVLLVARHAPGPDVAAYEATQAATLSLVRTLAGELRPASVTVNAVLVTDGTDETRLAEVAIAACAPSEAPASGQVYDLSQPSKAGD